MREGITELSQPMAEWAWIASAAPCVNSGYSCHIAPMKTPVRVPPRPAGERRASSTAAYATSRAIRCCGSICRASAGGMPKCSASNRMTSSRNPPLRFAARPDASASAHAEAFQRLAGT
ncbi:hypothetical protein SGRI78S_06054 [Streptomyces griseus subsp. griseus]